MRMKWPKFHPVTNENFQITCAFKASWRHTIHPKQGSTTSPGWGFIFLLNSHSRRKTSFPQPALKENGDKEHRFSGTNPDLRIVRQVMAVKAILAPGRDWRPLDWAERLLSSDNIRYASHDPYTDAVSPRQSPCARLLGAVFSPRFYEHGKQPAWGMGQHRVVLFFLFGDCHDDDTTRIPTNQYTTHCGKFA